MIQNVIWPDPQMGEFCSPFLRGGKERSLRLSLHVQSLKNLSEEDSAGYTAIRELGQLDLIDVLASGEDTFPYWRFLPRLDTNGYLHLEVLRDGTVSSLHCGIHLDEEDRDKRFDDLANNDTFAARAHIALHRDIFVTASPSLLGCREKFKRANIHSPLEASRLVGLFLRSRDNWTYQRVGVATCLTSRHSFYWVSSRTRLPALWRYFSACVHAREFRGDEILYLGQSVLERSSRALQARDAIGEQFYLSQDHDTGDVIMYHFDYLTLLLAGIFDAQAKIAKIVYGLDVEDNYVSFRNERFFLPELQKRRVTELYKVVTNDRCKQLMVMLHTLRNTIHHAGLTTTLSRIVGRERSLIEVPDALQEKLWQAAVALGGPDEWGVSREEYRLMDAPTGPASRKVSVSIEPYSYATCLVSEWFGLINQVANATEVERLFSGRNLPELSSGPPKDWVECPRFSVLG